MRILDKRFIIALKFLNSTNLLLLNKLSDIKFIDAVICMKCLLVFEKLDKRTIFIIRSETKKESNYVNSYFSNGKYFIQFVSLKKDYWYIKNLVNFNDSIFDSIEFKEFQKVYNNKAMVAKNYHGFCF